MKALAVGLAAVVGLVPVFAQASYAEVLPPSSVVLPVGDELEDTALADVDGEAGPILLLKLKLWKFGKWVAGVLTAAERMASHGCQKALQAAERAADKIADLTIRGVTLTAQKATEHPLMRDTVLGMAGGVTGEAVRAGLENRQLTLVDVGFGLAWGGLSGAGLHGIVRGLEELGRRRP